MVERRYTTMARKAIAPEVKAARLVEKGVNLPVLDGSATENMLKVLTALANAGFKVVPVTAKKTA